MGKREEGTNHVSSYHVLRYGRDVVGLSALSQHINYHFFQFQGLGLCCPVSGGRFLVADSSLE